MTTSARRVPRHVEPTPAIDPAQTEARTSLKIAICGSAPSSAKLAPTALGDDWQVWGCSPGGHVQVGRVEAPFRTFAKLHAWFELHLVELDQPWFDPHYVGWLSQLQVPVWTIEPVSIWPTSVAYPRDDVLSEFGPYFFTSSIAWMMALAILKKPDEIGLFGVDMAAHEEYAYQRPGCYYFIQEARRRGIKVSAPPQSEILVPPPLYGFSEQSHMHLKLRARAAELAGKLGEAQAGHDQKVKEVMFFKGAIENLEYIRKTWL